MDVSKKVLDAAILGPQKKGLKIKEINSNKEHEFNVKPVSISVDHNGEIIVFGQISHCLSVRSDDQVWFGFKKNNNIITPRTPESMIVEKKDGGIAATIGMTRFFGELIAKYYGQDADKFYDKLEEYKDYIGILDFDQGWEKAVCNFLKCLSERIQQPKLLAEKNLTLYGRKNFSAAGTKKIIPIDQNISDFDSIGMNDIVSSLHVEVPQGKILTLYDKKDYKSGKNIVLNSGWHFIRDLQIHKLEDKIDSCKWENYNPNRTSRPQLNINNFILH